MRQLTIITIFIVLGSMLILPPGVHGQDTGEPYAFRYEEIELDGGDTVVRRVRHTATEKQQKDEERIAEILAEIDQYMPPGGGDYVDPRAVAEWQYYWEQLKLWDRFVKQKILEGKDLNKKVRDLNFADPTKIDMQLQEVYVSHVKQAEDLAYDYYNRVIKLLGRIEDRIWQREVYLSWVQENKEKLQEFANEWLRRVTGAEIEIEGKVYLVSQEPLKAVPQDKVNIVTDNLTPYDILNDDGTLKKQPTGQTVEQSRE